MRRLLVGARFHLGLAYFRCSFNASDITMWLIRILRSDSPYRDDGQFARIDHQCVPGRTVGRYYHVVPLQSVKRAKKVLTDECSTVEPR